MAFSNSKYFNGILGSWVAYVLSSVPLLGNGNQWSIRQKSLSVTWDGNMEVTQVLLSPSSLPLTCPQLMDGSRLSHRLLMYQQSFHVPKSSDFLTVPVFSSCEMLIPVFTVLQILLWLDFGLVSQSSWFSCFLCWLCWPRQEPHTKSKFGLFLNIYKVPQGTEETEIVSRAGGYFQGWREGLGYG